MWKKQEVEEEEEKDIFLGPNWLAATAALVSGHKSRNEGKPFELLLLVSVN